VIRTVSAVKQETGLLSLGSPVSHWMISANRPVCYEVRICRDVLDPSNPVLLEDTAPGTSRVRRFIVTDETVDQLYGDAIRTYFEAWGVTHRICVLPAAEEHKTLDNVERMIHQLDEFGIDRRREPIIGIGGGVLLDIVGFSAGAYRRGTPFVRVPTTLIGLVDAGVGVKTGVNFHGHKNRLGSYFAAGRTLLDRTFLKTLDRRHISNGMAEILKIALIKDSRLFDLLEQHGQVLLDNGLQGEDPQYLWEGVPPNERLRARLPEQNVTTEVLERAIHGMLEELAPNLWEQVLERVVDYGHTFSPAIEMRALPELLHGEAVTIDMALTTVLAEHRGLVSSAQRCRIFEVMRVLELPIWHPLCAPDVLLPALRDTVRHRDGAQRLPLPVGIGAAVFINNVSEQEIVRASAALTDLGAYR
jgi:2-epi-5-epi-valiolone synthase